MHKTAGYICIMHAQSQQLGPQLRIAAPSSAPLPPCLTTITNSVWSLINACMLWTPHTAASTCPAGANWPNNMWLHKQLTLRDTTNWMSFIGYPYTMQQAPL